MKFRIEVTLSDDMDPSELLDTVIELSGDEEASVETLD